MKMSGFILIISLCIFFNFHQKGIEGRSLNETHVELEMKHPLDSRLSSTELNLPKNNTLENSSRKPKFMTHLSFLTGLGIGSLASAAAFSNANITPPFLFTTTTTTTTPKSPMSEVNFSSPEFRPLNRFQNAHYNPNYDYSAILSANTLFNQTLRGIERVLDKLKAIREEEPETIPQGYDDVEVAEDQNEEKVHRLADNPLTINCSTLKDIFRSTVAEEFNKLRMEPGRQAEGESGGSADENTEMPEEMEEEANKKDKTTTTTTTTTEMTPTMPSSGYYYGGNPLNISGVSITSGAYGPPQYPIYPPISLPNEIHNTLPVYNAEPFRHEFPHEHYFTHPDSSGDSYPGYYDPHFDYSRYGRGKKFATQGNINSYDNGRFYPSPYVPNLQ